MTIKGNDISLRALTDLKTASWGWIWMGPKHCETSNLFSVESAINGVNIIINSEAW